MRCRGKPPSEWAVSWPKRSKSSTKKHKNHQGVPSQPARYSLEFFPYGSCLGQTKSPKIQFAKKVMESKRKPSDSQRNPRAGGRSAGIRTRGLLDLKIRLKSQGVFSAPFGAVCSSRKCFPDLSAPMPHPLLAWSGSPLWSNCDLHPLRWLINSAYRPELIHHKNAAAAAPPNYAHTSSP